MIEIGTVHKKLSSNRVKVRFSRKTACENCNMCLKPKNEMFVEIVCDNTLNAKINDRVTVEMGEKSILTAALIVYLVPVVLVTIALFAFKSLGEWWQFGSAIFMLLLGFTCSYIIDKKLKRKKGFCPIMKEILSNDKKEEIQITKEEDNEQ